jgi:T-complex protein 1 subunit epsilon
VYIVRDEPGKSQTTGVEAARANVAAAQAVCNVLATSLGPKGSDKLLVSPDGEMTISNDGATILKEMEVQHPVARLLVDLSTCQDSEIGDGTTGVVVLAGALLEQALPLLDRGIHPTRISEGFDIACKIAVERLQAIADVFEIDPEHPERLLLAAKTALGSKIINRHHDKMAQIAVEAVLSVADLERRDVDFDLIKVRGKVGARLEDTRLVHGIVLDKDISHPQMAKEIDDAKIAILSCPFEPPRPKTKYVVNIDTVEKYNELYRTEQEYFTKMVQMVKDTGATFVVCQWGFDDEANHLLMLNQLPAVRWAAGEDMEAIAVATDGRICPRFEQLSSTRLGSAGRIREICFGTQSDKMVTIEGCANSRLVTVFVRGGNQMIVEEAKRALHDAMCVTRNLIRDPSIIYGGGAAEVACSLAISERADEVETIEQYALRAFADALDAIPLQLARNCGLAPIETLSEVKAAQKATGNHRIGVDCMRLSTMDMRDQNVFETLSSKVQQLQLATQVTKMILKIDSVIEHTGEQ